MQTHARCLATSDRRGWAALVLLTPLIFVSGRCLYLQDVSGDPCESAVLKVGTAAALTAELAESLWERIARSLYSPNDTSSCFWAENRALADEEAIDAVHSDPRGPSNGDGTFFADDFGRVFVILLSGGEPIAYLHFSNVAQLTGGASNVELSNVCVFAEHRGRGCGTRMIEVGLATAPATACE